MIKNSKLIKTICLIVTTTSLLLGSQTLCAQNDTEENKTSKFGNFLRRIGESATGINMSDELFIKFDTKAQTAAQIMEVSCEGNPANGEVLVTLRIMGKQDGVTLSLGGSDDYATDAKGNKYHVTERHIKKQDLITDVPIRYEFIIQKVPTDLAYIERLYLNFYMSGAVTVGSNMSGVNELQIRNIPIKWKPAATKNIISESYKLTSISNLKVINCEGDKTTGTVSLKIGATSSSSQANLNLNEMSCYDHNGTKYNGRRNDENANHELELNQEFPTIFSFAITEVDPNLKAFYVIKLDFYARDRKSGITIGSNMSGIDKITIKNVPINWK